MVLGIEITTRVCGYMEINYDGILLDGGIGIMCDIGYDLYIPIIAIPVYATVPNPSMSTMALYNRRYSN